jgi:hypothetical protein
MGDLAVSFVASITHCGYIRNQDGTYRKKSQPPIEFEYTQPILSDIIRDVDPESLENLPQGLSRAYQFVDLDGEGVAGILTSQVGSLFYKPNLGSARFGAMETLTTVPSLADGKQQMLDLAGSGLMDVVQFNGHHPGFFKRNLEHGWNQFTVFRSLPNVLWDNPNLRFVDLNGDGLADILVTEDNIFNWYPSLSEDGFGPGENWKPPLDEEKGPRLVFADGEQAVYLSDMSGDGLIDLVRIRHNSVCYWPSLGYGRFGTKVTMDHAPLLDSCDIFSQNCVRLADIDGSGTTDLIYLASDGAHLYFNQSGNRFSAAKTIPLPPTDTLTDVSVLDLLGIGTTCLVWSSPKPHSGSSHMRYIELMDGKKPHLLLSQKNNLGAEMHISYAPSMKFYLMDKQAGNPWATRLHFPVQVVERVETLDRIAGNRFVQRYAYHHGCYDGVEREFRRFGLVEQRDTEEFAVLSISPEFLSAANLDQASHVPPVLTKTWFHTGVFTNTDRLSRHFETEYFREPLTDAQSRAMLLDDTVLPTSIHLDGIQIPHTLSAEETREACRALMGSILRQEVYSQDGSEVQGRPYIVSERNFTIEFLQPQGENPTGVFFTHAREVLEFHYERKTYPMGKREVFDPRVVHQVTLEVDEWGNEVKSATGYGRRSRDPSALLTAEDHKKQVRREKQKKHFRKRQVLGWATKAIENGRVG